MSGARTQLGTNSRPFAHRWQTSRNETADLACPDSAARRVPKVGRREVRGITRTLLLVCRATMSITVGATMRSDGH